MPAGGVGDDGAVYTVGSVPTVYFVLVNFVPFVDLTFLYFIFFDINDKSTTFAAATDLITFFAIIICYHSQAKLITTKKDEVCFYVLTNKKFSLW